MEVKSLFSPFIYEAFHPLGKEDYYPSFTEVILIYRNFLSKLLSTSPLPIKFEEPILKRFNLWEEFIFYMKNTSLESLIQQEKSLIYQLTARENILIDYLNNPYPLMLCDVYRRVGFALSSSTFFLKYTVEGTLCGFKYELSPLFHLWRKELFKLPVIISVYTF